MDPRGEGHWKKLDPAHATVRFFMCEKLGHFTKDCLFQGSSREYRVAHRTKWNIQQNRRTSLNNNEHYLDKNFPTETKRVNSFSDNNSLWVATDRSESSLDVLLDSGASEHVVNNAAFLTDVEHIPPTLMK